MPVEFVLSLFELRFFFFFFWPDFLKLVVTRERGTVTRHEFDDFDPLLLDECFIPCHVDCNCSPLCSMYPNISPNVCLLDETLLCRRQACLRLNRISLSRIFP